MRNVDYKPTRGSVRSLLPFAGKIRSYVFPMNPNKLQESVNVIWREQQIFGMSHPNMHYIATGAHQLPVEFYVSKQRMEAELGRVISESELLEFKRFLQALTVPARGEGDVTSGSPPRVLFDWPWVVSMTCVLRNLTVTYTKFAITGAPISYTAKVAFSEIRDVRMYSGDIMEQGSMRAEV